MAVNYNDKRFMDVETDKTEALTELEKIYGTPNEKGKYVDENNKPVGIIGESESYFKDLISNSRRGAEKREEAQQAQTDFAIEKIEQQKDQAEKDYLKEQSGAYTDWQKQSNAYGANAEAMAAQGMANTGYAESSQVSMFNAYQNRIATARETYNRAVLNYDNAIQEAKLQNSSILAEIAFEAQQKQLELALQGFQYKNQLILDMADQKRAIEESYYSRYKDVLQQINTENSLAWDKEKFNKQMTEEQRQFNILHPQTSGAKITKNSSPVSNPNRKKYYDENGKEITKEERTTKADNMIGAVEYLESLISSGATKDKVSNEIAIALREGAITAKQAQDLRNRFTPRGLQY